MALFLFTWAIIAGEPIKVFNNDNMSRDFIYIDDVVGAVVRPVGKAPEPDQHWNGDRPDPATSLAPYHIYNIGNHTPVKLLPVIVILEDCLGRKAHMEPLPMQPRDVPATYADIGYLARDTGFSPSTSIEIGIEQYLH